MASSKALCKLKAVLAARLILHRDKKKKINQEKLFLLASHIHGPGAGAEKATGQRTSLSGLPAARPSLLLLLLSVSPAFSEGRSSFSSGVGATRDLAAFGYAKAAARS